MPDLTFRRYDAAGAQRIRATVEAIYRGAHVGAIASSDPFYTADAFMERFDACASRDGFDFIIAWLDEEPVGQAALRCR